ncbi:NusG domain II-containing protein [Clostridium sp. YIM B02506]|uniref:NusG domain II-containing protein n=1 Tax=Clostridium sp. YIM B02506 TaxID=2910680 RepID=UPI001EEF6732|nr:NusG domain II-containing protein [Clostridium sp. YIM B02506]
MKILEFKILDKVIIVVLLILSFLPLGIFMIVKGERKNTDIVIKIDNKVEKKVPLNKSSESITYQIDFNNNIGYIEVKDSKVRMLEMSKEICPNSICSDIGWIDNTYQSIVCLPNNIIVTIEGVEEDTIDAQTF